MNQGVDGNSLKAAEWNSENTVVFCDDVFCAPPASSLQRPLENAAGCRVAGGVVKGRSEHLKPRYGQPTFDKCHLGQPCCLDQWGETVQGGSSQQVSRAGEATPIMATVVLRARRHCACAAFY